MGAEHSPEESCDRLLDINGLVAEGQLQLDWTYSENFHQRSTIENLAEDFVVSLRSLIAHCLSADVSENQIIQSLDHQINNSQPVPLHLL
ncbi:MAG TPA: hypothetical protein DCY88_09020 [Cyanobacteria bacterium UBA11372]|nr:hypothetical protein [Cyanobacteria bacterium UBA11372]